MVKSVKRKSPLSCEDFTYLDSALLPALVLGVPFREKDSRTGDFAQKTLSFKAGRKWQNIAHQTAGVRCHQFHLQGTVLTPRNDQVKRGMKALETKWLSSNHGGFVSLDKLIEYRNDLHELFGVDCNHSYRDFAEGLYPVDIDYLPQMNPDRFGAPLGGTPQGLDELCEWASGMERAIGSTNRWGLWILGKNSD